MIDSGQQEGQAAVVSSRGSRGTCDTSSVSFGFETRGYMR